MARKPTSREYFLIGVLAVALIVVLYVGRRGGFNLGGGDSGRSDGEPSSIGDAPQILMERLTQPAEAYDPRARNLFAYYTPPPPQPPKLPARPKRPPVVKSKQPPPRPVERPRSTRSRGPSPPGIAFTYLGYLGPKDDKIAVFELGEEMLIARAGEVVQKQFRVVGFGYETVVMGYTDERFKDRTTELSLKPK